MHSPVLLVVLQVLDVLTTLFFLRLGLEEGNPLVKWLMNFASRLESLAFLKVIAVVLLIVGSMRKDYKWLLPKANLFYIALVSWNIFCILDYLAR